VIIGFAPVASPTGITESLVNAFHRSALTASGIPANISAALQTVRGH
jgi:hypothetical protein